MKFLKVLILFFLIQSISLYSQVSIGSSAQATVNPFRSEDVVTDPEINRVISIVNTVETKSNFIEQLNPDSNVSLPFGLIRQIGAARYVIAIDSMNFFSDGAYFSAYAAIDFPGTLKKLAFRGSHLKFNPKGVIGGDQAKLYLASDHVIRINASVTLKLSGNRKNWVEWDCNGFKQINLEGSFIFKKAKLLPDPSQTSDSVVTASFSIKTENIHNFITKISITPFKIAGLDDWGFRVTDAIVDMSELSNDDNMMFPLGYLNPNNVTPQMWTGFALQSLLVKLPKEISKTGTSTEISVNNLLIDNMGVSGLFQVNNIFKSTEGNLGNWDFSIDELGAGFVCNQLTSGHLKGTVNIPIMDSAQKLQYTADLYYNTLMKNVDYNFVIKPASDLRFAVFSANVNLNNNSSISVSRMNGYFKPTAILNGSISFDNSKFNSNGGELSFQNLTITSEAPYITNGIFGLHNINGGRLTTGFYPIQVNDVIFGIDKGVPVLGFNVRLNLTDIVENPLSCGTSILIKGKIETKEQFYSSGTSRRGQNISKTKWSLDKVLINGASLEIETSPFTLKGNILFNDNHPVYGNGFFGLLDLFISKVIEDPIGVNVGFGCKEHYKYFFLDAKVPAKYIVPSTPIGLSSIIGGVYYHMQPNKTTETELVSLSQNFNNVSGNALTYIPSPTVALGIKMGATGEFVPNESVFNGDFLLDIHFTSHGGLGAISLAGNVYSMAKISNKINAPLKGRMVMTFDPQTKAFDALAQVNIVVYRIISGNGYLKVHFDPKVWYVCAGRPSAPNNIKILNIVEAPSYFMTGNTLENAWQLPAPFSSNRDAARLTNGSGFCAGAKIHSSLTNTFGFSFFNVGGSYNFDIACDLSMLDYGEKATCSGSAEKIGINGKLAQGDMYLGMTGGVSINGHFKFPNECPKTTEICTNCCGCCCKVTVGCLFNESFNYNVYTAEVNALVYTKLPSPLYFKGQLNCLYDFFGGRVKGSFNFDYAYGTDCDPISN